MYDFGGVSKIWFVQKGEGCVTGISPRSTGALEAGSSLQRQTPKG